MKTWTTKDGQKVKIRDLDTDHLRNILAMLWRNRVITYNRTIGMYAFGEQPAGEMAMDAFDSECEILSEMRPTDLFRETTRDLRREAKRRGIKIEDWKT